MGRGFQGGIHKAPEGSMQAVNYGKWYVSGSAGGGRGRRGNGRNVLDEVVVRQWMDRGNLLERRSGESGLLTNTINSINRVAKAGQTWVKENKTAIMQTAKNMQTVGDATAKAGYVAAIAGAPVVGVGSSPGIALAATGNTIVGIGKGVEILTDFVTEDFNAGVPKAVTEFGTRAAGAVGDKAIGSVLPGYTPGTTKELITETHGIVLDLVVPQPPENR